MLWFDSWNFQHPTESFEVQDDKSEWKTWHPKNWNVSPSLLSDLLQRRCVTLHLFKPGVRNKLKKFAKYYY